LLLAPPVFNDILFLERVRQANAGEEGEELSSQLA
jgi:hypothetical protein